MELPPALRQAIDKALEGVPIAKLAQDVARLSRLYREEARPAGYHVAGDDAARAYLAARLPATYAAARAAMAEAAERVPDFAPRSLIDIGAGPGTVLWAASDLWPSLVRADLVECSPAMRAAGAPLVGASAVPAIAWHASDVSRALPSLDGADLVTAGYVLNELSPASIDAVIDRLWAMTTGMIVVIEPGTPAGYRHVLQVRARLLRAGAHLVAPCPHAETCPLQAPDWCHFSQRVARSRVHRAAKGADAPWEDERFSYVAASRSPVPPSPSRVIAPVQQASGHLTLKLCKPDGTAALQPLSRRDGEAYRRAKRLDWGDTFEA
jgi:ribosomal protein RSM22 (predicted rRNA methylase)